MTFEVRSPLIDCGNKKCLSIGVFLRVGLLVPTTAPNDGVAIDGELDRRQVAKGLDHLWRGLYAPYALDFRLYNVQLPNR